MIHNLLVANFIAEPRRELVQKLLEHEIDDLYEVETIAHCRRGIILWVVRKTTAKQQTIKLDAGQSINRIKIFRLVKSKFDTTPKWGYFEFDEDRPYSRKCPLKYLELAPEINSTWRKRVREYHQQRRLKLR